MASCRGTNTLRCRLRLRRRRLSPSSPPPLARALLVVQQQHPVSTASDKLPARAWLRPKQPRHQSQPFPGSWKYRRSHEFRAFSASTTAAPARSTPMSPAATTTTTTTTTTKTATTTTNRIPTGPVTSALKDKIDSGSIRDDERQWEAATELDRLCEDLLRRGRPNDWLASNDPVPLLPSWWWGESPKHRGSTFAQSRRHPRHRGGISNNRDGAALSSQTNANANQLPLRSALRWLARRFVRLVTTPVRGVYLYGSVGVGKSLVMDLFHETVLQLREQHMAEVQAHSNTGWSSVSSRRVHFHEFMLDVHQRIHAATKEHHQHQHRQDALLAVASDLAKDARVLCLDEFQVTDIADAMILKRLFEALLEHGTVVVATSNRPPSKLYEGGLNRASFLPFVDTLREHCAVLAMEGDRDYRKDPGNNRGDGEGFRRKHHHPDNNGDNDNDNDNNHNHNNDTPAEEGSRSSSPTYYFCPIDDPTIRSALASIVGDDRERDTIPEVLEVPMGRTLAARTSSRNPECGVFSFEELCGNTRHPMGPHDYLALAERYSVLVVEGIPLLDGSVYNEARRFVTLVDACYEARVRLVVTASVPLSELFVEFEAEIETSDGDEETSATELEVLGEGGSSSSGSTTTIKAKGGSGDAIEWSATGRIGVSLAQLSSVKEVVFSFRRAESRLHELCNA